MRPLGDRVLIRPLEQAREINGFEIPSEYAHTEETTGTVIALGSGPVTAKGVRLDHFVRVGDVVIFSPMSGQEMNLDGERILTMRESEILAVL